MFAFYAKFAELLDKHIADDFFVVALTASMGLLAKTFGLLP